MQYFSHTSSCFQYRLPEFYRPAKFHASVLWTLGGVGGQIEKFSEDLERIFKEEEAQEETLEVEVTQLECKSGNKVFQMSLG